MAGNDWGSGAFLVGFLATVAFPHFLTSGGVHLKQEAEEKPVMISSVGDYLAGGPVMVGALLAMAVFPGAVAPPRFPHGLEGRNGWFLS